MSKWALCLVWSMFALWGCHGSRSNDERRPGEVLGTLRVALRATAPDGVVYRLAQGSFVIEGASSATIDTASAPDAVSRQQALVAGEYTIALAAGWRLERAREDATWAASEATLVTENPLAFTVSAGVTTDVRFVFRVGQDEVVLEPGSVSVGIGIELEDAGAQPQDAGTVVLPEPPDVDVLTRGYDVARTNANLEEVVLNRENVRAATFGKLFELAVDDQVYAQILHVGGLEMGGVRRDVIYVATVNNTVYAFDADAPGAPLWSRNFNGLGRPTKNHEVGQNCQPYRDFSDNIGIVGTPVIDRAASAMYFVTRTVEGASTRQHLRAVDLVTGENKGAGSVLIEGSVQGTGAGTSLGRVAFQPAIQNQRLALGLSQGHLYIGWSGFCDTGDYHGWVMAYEAATLKQSGIFNATPNGWAGGIWQAGAAPVFDGQGNVYLGTGNGDYDGVRNLGETVLKLSPRTLQHLDHFAPSNWNSLNAADLDLGSAGPTWLPGTSLVVLAGKEGKLYLMRSQNLGRSAPSDTQLPQSFQLVDPSVRPNATHHLHNGVALWEGPAGLHMYAAGENDYVRAYRFDRSTGVFELPAAQRSEVLPPVGMPGGMVTVSADAAKEGTGLVWVTTPRAGNANQNVTPGILRAYDAQTLELLWDSASDADDILEFAKFNNPTVAEGKVYVASFSRVVHVFGLRSPAPPPRSINLALMRPVMASQPPCNPAEGADKIVDGLVYSQTEADRFKWCTHAPTPFANVDLGEAKVIDRIVVRHAGEGGESISYNTRAFRLRVGLTLSTLSTVATVTNNTLSKTVHEFTPVTARYVQLNVDSPTQTLEDGTRIYEVEVYGPEGASP